MIEQPVLPQPFAMIGGHDHERLFEHAATLEVVDQFTQPLVQIGQAVVVGIAARAAVPAPGIAPLVGLRPALGEEPQVGDRSSAPDRGGCETLRREQVGRMGIDIIQEGEEGTPRLPAPRQPSRNSRFTTRASFRSPRVSVHGAFDAGIGNDAAELADGLAATRRSSWAVLSRIELVEDIILVMGEAAIEAAVVRAVERVADEPRRRIAERSQVFGQGRHVPPQRARST